jgi:cytidylate kinase
VIVAVDGPAASGKGTLARRIAAHFGLAYLDTGKIYRAVGYRVLCGHGDPDDLETALGAARALDPAALDDPALSNDEVAGAASRVAAIGPVREALLAFQQDFAAAPPGGARGAVLDGRDIGTVVCPDADVKLFVVADIAVRAGRRHKELLDRGKPSIYARVLKDLMNRDDRDRNRSAAPLIAACDAIALDTSMMTPDEAFEAALEIIGLRVTGS